MSIKNKLTPRQFEILEHLAQGKTYDQIALALDLHIGYIKKAMCETYARLDVHHTGNASVLATIAFRKEYPDTPTIDKTYGTLPHVNAS